MKFKFKVQKYQTDAVDSIVKVFEGQGYHGSIVHRHDFGTFERDKQARFDTEGDLFSASENAFMNYGITLSDQELLSNINNIQYMNGIKKSAELDRSLGRCSLDIEMETGTGKTYVYIKSIFELNKNYGWTKFIVVVPSIAIREGVEKSFEITTDHFMDLYGKKIRHFVYDSSNLHEIDDYTQNDGIHVMIINSQAFTATFKEGAKNEASRIMYSERDEFGSRRPIDVIKSNNPIIILDEPQKLGGPVTQKALKEQFNALFSMNFSATHAKEHNLIYILDAVDAYNQKLVKKIEVKGFELKSIGGASCYLYLEEIVLDPNKPPRARIEIEVKHQNGTPREMHLFNEGDSLYAASNELQEYSRITVIHIDPYQNKVMFSNNIELFAGEALGDVSEKELRRLQIRATILSHLDKEEKLFHMGIKCLSLFFIDRVDKYRIYDENGNAVLGEYGKMFEKEYTKIIKEQGFAFDWEYINYLKKFPVRDIHEGYFSIDRKSKRDVESSTRKEGEAELAAYEKILKRKDILLDRNEPIRFIFSHSALREGWDNPNIFQICALKHTDVGPDSNRARRQEVGRGLRICVNESGDRMDFEDVGDSFDSINTLTVVANENYADYVGGLQSATREDLRERPIKITQSFFKDKKIMVEEGEMYIDDFHANVIYRYLATNDLIDYSNQFKKEHIDEVINGQLPPMPPELEGMESGVVQLLQAVASGSSVESMFSDGRRAKIKENQLNENFKKPEFQALWNEINNKYAYYVNFNSKELILKASAAIEDELKISKMKYTLTVGRQVDSLDRDKLEKGEGFKTVSTETKDLDNIAYSDVKYDLIGEISKGCTLTRRTVGSILKKITEKKFNLFKDNPEEFIRKVIRLINESKAAIIVEHISYKKTDEQPYDSDIFTMSRPVADYNKAFRAKKHIADYVFTDGIAEKSTERKFAEELDNASEVSVYAKLPTGFKIPTPVGNYSPDWAIAFYDNCGVKHIYFVAETKGSMASMQLRSVEKAKISCAETLFNKLKLNKARYGKADTYDQLLSVINDLE